MGGEWIFKTDDDGHWYWIPAYLEFEFADMLNAATERDDYSDFEDYFGHMRCSHPTSYVFDDKRLK